MRSVWAGSRLCLPISSWMGSCWLSVWTELCGVTVSLVSSVGVFRCLLLICLFPCLCWYLSEFNWCLLKFFWCLFCLSAPLSGSFKEGLAGVCLDWVRVSSISFWWTHQVLLEVSPTVCLSVSPSGILGFLLGGLVGAFDVCCSVFPDSPIHRDWVLSITLYHPFIWVFSLFLMKLAFTLLLSL